MHRVAQASLALLLLPAFALASDDDIHWFDGFAPPPAGEGLNDKVLAMTEYDGQLVVGGDFTMAGDLAVNYLAQWTGSDWLALGTSPDGVVSALGTWNGQLVAGGAFTTIGGVSAGNVAAWDGATWSALGLGVDATVKAIVEFEGDLIIGGHFLNAGATPASYIARWDGATWSEIGGGMDSRVEALAVYDGDLIAGGLFDIAGGTLVNHIARWDGVAWQSMAGGMSARVRALAVWYGSLAVGGGFEMAGGAPASRIALWDGAVWSSLGGGADDEVFALASYNGYLVAGGAFQAVDVPASHVGAWNGSAWRSLGSGIDDDALSICLASGDLFIAGGFNHAGGVLSQSIARWARATDAIHYVPQEFATIQRAVDASPGWSEPGSYTTVILSPGAYAEDVQIVRKDVRLIGEAMASTTVRSLYWEAGGEFGGARDLTVETSLITSGIYPVDLGQFDVTRVAAPVIHVSGIGGFSIHDCAAIEIRGYGEDYLSFPDIGGCTAETIEAFSDGGCSVGGCTAESITVDAWEQYANASGNTVLSGNLVVDGNEATASYNSVLLGNLSVAATCDAFWARAKAIGNTVLSGELYVGSDHWLEAVANQVAGTISAGAPNIRLSHNQTEGLAALFSAPYCDYVVPIGCVIDSNLVIGDGGIRINGASLADLVVVKSNTIVDAMRGIQLTEQPMLELQMVRNVVTSCAVGISLPSPGPSTVVLSCNDVWDSSEAAWQGIEDPTGLDGNIAADPLFCADEVYSLAENSPCLPGNHPDGYDCGLIGALGQGCGPALANLAPAGFVCLPDSAAAWADDPDSLRVGAIVINDGNLTSGTFDVRIEIEGCVGFWGDTQTIGPLSPGEVDTVFAGPFAVEPHQCTASVFVDYNDDETESSELDNDVVDASVCTVVGVPGGDQNAPTAWTAWPNPAFSSVRFNGPLPIVDISIFDVHGRLVRHLTPSGADHAVWDRTTESGGTTAPGVYFARMRHESGETTLRVLIGR